VSRDRDDLVPIILALTVFVAVTLTIIGMIIVTPNERITEIIVLDLMSLMQSMIAGLFGLVAGVSIARANKTPLPPPPPPNKETP
jgi:hypothetical protein